MGLYGCMNACLGNSSRVAWLPWRFARLYTLVFERALTGRCGMVEGKKKPIEQYDQTDKFRGNNPPVGLATPRRRPTPTITVVLGADAGPFLNPSNLPHILSGASLNREIKGTRANHT